MHVLLFLLLVILGLEVHCTCHQERYHLSSVSIASQ